MTAQHLAATVLAALAVLVVAASAVGALVVRPVLSRLHFLSPVTSLAGPLFGVAVVVDLGWGISAGLVLLIVGLLAITAPVLEAATGRLAGLDTGLLRESGPEAQEPSQSGGEREGDGR